MRRFEVLACWCLFLTCLLCPGVVAWFTLDGWQFAIVGSVATAVGGAAGMWLATVAWDAFIARRFRRRKQKGGWSNG